MFELYYKPSGCIVDIYDIKYNNKTGFPHFLFYLDGRWNMRSAKYFRPVLPEDMLNRVFKKVT